MARLECGKCKSVFKDVVRVRKCPLCGSTEFSSADPSPISPLALLPLWFTRQGNTGFFYPQTMRTEPGSTITVSD